MRGSLSLDYEKKRPTIEWIHHRQHLENFPNRLMETQAIQLLGFIATQTTITPLQKKKKKKKQIKGDFFAILN